MAKARSPLARKFIKSEKIGEYIQFPDTKWLAWHVSKTSMLEAPVGTLFAMPLIYVTDYAKNSSAALKADCGIK